MAHVAARHQSRGSCSAHPVWAEANATCSTVAEVVTRPSVSTTTARVPPVPTSIPRNFILLGGSVRGFLNTSSLERKELCYLFGVFNRHSLPVFGTHVKIRSRAIGVVLESRQSQL